MKTNHTTISTLLMLLAPLISLAEGTTFSFGVIADCQYCNSETAGVRQYRDSPDKLRACVEDLNKQELEFTVHLGDFIDRDWDSFDVVLPIYESLRMPSWHVLGNHDFSVADDKKAHVHRKLGMPAQYYEFAVHGWRFVALNGNDISLHAWPAGSPEQTAAIKYYDDNRIESPKWNGAIGEKQIAWLRNVLKDAADQKESVILMAHFPVFPENVHNLWNASEVIALIEEFSCVKAYINGHNHAGNYGEKSGVHYITFKGMVDTAENSYATVLVTPQELRVTGFGREKNRTLAIRK